MSNDRTWKFSEIHYNTFGMNISSLHKVVWSINRQSDYVINNIFRIQRATTTHVVHRDNCRILASDSHNRNIMHASCLTQFVFVTLNAFLTVWFVAVNRDILETKLKLINQLLIINELNFPPASILLFHCEDLGNKTNLSRKIICAFALSSF